MYKHLKLRFAGKTLKIDVRFDEAKNVEEYNRRISAVLLAQRQAMRGDLPPEAFGDAVTALYTLVFGEEVTHDIEALYGDDVESMMTHVNVFISREISPCVEEASRREMERRRREFIRERKKAVRNALR